MKWRPQRQHIEPTTNHLWKNCVMHTQVPLAGNSISIGFCYHVHRNQLFNEVCAPTNRCPPLLGAIFWLIPRKIVMFHVHALCAHTDDTSSRQRNSHRTLLRSWNVIHQFPCREPSSTLYPEAEWRVCVCYLFLLLFKYVERDEKRRFFHSIIFRA